MCRKLSHGLFLFFFFSHSDAVFFGHPSFFIFLSPSFFNYEIPGRVIQIVFSGMPEPRLCVGDQSVPRGFSNEYSMSFTAACKLHLLFNTVGTVKDECG